MDIPRQSNPNLATLPRSAFIIRENAPLCRLPHPEIGDQAPAVDLRPPPSLAQALVAGLESPPGAGVRLRHKRVIKQLRSHECRRHQHGTNTSG